MPCYLRNLDDVIADAGIELSKQNREAVDRAIRRTVGKLDGECPEVWKEVELWLSSGRRQELVDGLTQELLVCGRYA